MDAIRRGGGKYKSILVCVRGRCYSERLEVEM